MQLAGLPKLIHLPNFCNDSLRLQQKFEISLIPSIELETRRCLVIICLISKWLSLAGMALG